MALRDGLRSAALREADGAPPLMSSQVCPFAPVARRRSRSRSRGGSVPDAAAGSPCARAAPVASPWPPDVRLASWWLDGSSSWAHLSVEEKCLLELSLCSPISRCPSLCADGWTMSRPLLLACVRVWEAYLVHVLRCEFADVANVYVRGAHFDLPRVAHLQFGHYLLCRRGEVHRPPVALPVVCKLGSSLPSVLSEACERLWWCAAAAASWEPCVNSSPRVVRVFFSREFVRVEFELDSNGRCGVLIVLVCVCVRACDRCLLVCHVN